jgi:hypothetical protein
MKFPPQDIWNIEELPDAARALLLHMDEPASTQTTFASLLDSESMTARGYALEMYALLQSDTRWGKDFPLAAFSDRVREHAVRLLDAAPLAPGESGALVAEANHASALRAMWAVAKQEDLALLIRSVRTAGTPLTQTRAARAALFWLQRWPDRPRALGEAMRALVENTDVARSARCIAMRCLLLYPDPDTESVLLEASMELDLEVATNAAWVLTRLDLEKHRVHLEALVDGWGDDPPYLGDEVREALGIV